MTKAHIVAVILRMQ